MNLDETKVPPALRPYLSLAVRFGISDDGHRLERIESATEIELKELTDTVRTIDDHLDDWLAGPQAEGPTFSDEYIAFSAMRMAADET